MKLPLSVAVIASNEEKNILRCLRSIVEIANEIVVVINDSQDETAEIARSLGENVRVYEESWHGFSAQKNLALERTSMPWILCLDADEEVDDELKDSMVEFIEADDASFYGAYFSRRTFFMGQWIKHGDWSPDYITRLIRKNHGSWSNDMIHEKLKVSGAVKKLSGHLLHYSFDDICDHMHKNIHYAELCENDYHENFIGIFLRSIWKFFRGYFLKLGFFDGKAGLYIALTQGMFTLYRHMLIFEKKTKNYISRENL